MGNIFQVVHSVVLTNASSSNHPQHGLETPRTWQVE